MYKYFIAPIILVNLFLLSYQEEQEAKIAFEALNRKNEPEQTVVDSIPRRQVYSVK